MLTLTGGRGNALDAARLEAIQRAFGPGAPDGPVVLGAEGRSFCTGLDLVGCFELDRDGMRDLMRSFHAALRAVALWPDPVVAAVQGHALAGGALLALAADERVVAHGGHRFGIHGVQLGVVYPQVAVEIVRHRLPRRLAEDVLYSGRLRPAHEAFTEGLVDELVEPDALAGRAVEVALERAKSPAHRGLKQRLHAPLAARLDHPDPEWAEDWLDRWFAPPTRERLAAARAALTNRTAPRPGELPD